MPRFQPGQSGNPSGRPRGLGDFRSKCQGMTDEALAALRAGLGDPERAAYCAKTLLEFGWGKAQQSVDHSGSGVAPIVVSINWKARK